MPPENYDYKPFADARPFGGELQHLGQAEKGFISDGSVRAMRPPRRREIPARPPR